ncbi:hypothetical protein KC347_g196 [Hortaea werneckii]|nr:hypothetical protein KC347_g196 [Hortaea werneckii]
MTIKLRSDKKESQRRSWHLGKDQRLLLPLPDLRAPQTTNRFSSRMKNDVGVRAPGEPKTSFVSSLGISGSRDLPT